MQMTQSPIKHDNADLNKQITDIGTTIDHFLTDLEENVYCISQVR